MRDVKNYSTLSQAYKHSYFKVYAVFIFVLKKKLRKKNERNENFI
jgi:hypothetical protein